LRALTEAGPGAWTLLLTDVRMPELDGPALARAAQTLDPALRVLFISGYADVKLDDDELGWVLAKPFTPRALLDRVWARLDAPVRARDPERSA
jgi:two-component system cell cycle response regulator CpdR